MLSLVLRGFMQRKLRVLLTAIAIALGVALMAGTYILTDTINKSFASIFSTANRGHDVVITPTQSLGRETRAQTSPITEQMLAQVRATPGVAEASGEAAFVAATLAFACGTTTAITAVALVAESRRSVAENCTAKRAPDLG